LIFSFDFMKMQIVIQKIDRGVLLFPLLEPLLKTLSACYSSVVTQSIAEGVTYSSRLQAVVERKVGGRVVN
jgi:hypothetical protein